jgi:hypothetical protein
VEAVGLNHLDVWVRKGVPGHQFPLPLVPGCDSAGVIEELGPGSEAPLAKRGLKVGTPILISPGISCGLCQACLGGFDPRYFILFEDLDLSYRLRLSGWKILSAEEALVLHKGGTGGISFRKGPRYPARRVFLHARNRWIFLLKNLSGWTLACALPGLLLYELAGLGFALLARAPHQWLLGKLDGLRLLPGLLAERRRIQSTRTVPDRELLPVVPLTVTPDARRGLRGGLERALSACLGAWWHCARILLAKH